MYATEQTEGAGPAYLLQADMKQPSERMQLQETLPSSPL
jgi:hypothetical protein